MHHGQQSPDAHATGWRAAACICGVSGRGHSYGLRMRNSPDGPGEMKQQTLRSAGGGENKQQAHGGGGGGAGENKQQTHCSGGGGENKQQTVLNTNDYYYMYLLVDYYILDIIWSMSYYFTYLSIKSLNLSTDQSIIPSLFPLHICSSFEILVSNLIFLAFLASETSSANVLNDLSVLDTIMTL
jgi:hypothetical protein